MLVCLRLLKWGQIYELIWCIILDEIEYADKEIDEIKIAENGEKKAVTEDDLDRTLDSGTLQANPYCKWPFCEKGDCQ